MVALNFKAQFADDVESGRKRRTIRALRKDGRDPEPGDTLQLYTGMRQKGCRKLGEAVCRLRARVRIEPSGVMLDGLRLTPGQLQEFAAKDGFATFDLMAIFFAEQHGLPFEGYLIEWR